MDRLVISVLRLPALALGVDERFFDDKVDFVSRLLQNGESVVYVKDQLGHHSIKVTVDVYGLLVPGANKAAVD